MPVGWSVLWSAEENARPWKVERCFHAGNVLALSPPDLPGEGKPMFGATHPRRQREAVSRRICEICGCSLAARTKVSMSEERLTHVAGVGYTLLVVEPLCCVPCARLSLQHCPHLRRRAEEGALSIRQVLKYQIVNQIMKPEAVEEFTGQRLEGITGHLKLALNNFKLRDVAWLDNQA